MNANTHEYLLHGSIVDGSVETLIQRIKGLADPKFDSFNEHVMVFALKTSTANVTSLLQARWPVDPTVDACYHIRYVGNPEPDVGPTPTPVLVRKVVDTLAKSDDMMAFFRTLGFRYEYGYVAEGYAFTKGYLKILISKISKLDVPGDINSAQKFTGSHLVELSALAPSGETAVAKSIRDFADQLKPLVQLEKLDYTTLVAQN